MLKLLWLMMFYNIKRKTNLKYTKYYLRVVKNVNSNLLGFFKKELSKYSHSEKVEIQTN